VAKLSANGNEVVRLHVVDADKTLERRYSFRDTGKVLVQSKIAGRWEGWKSTTNKMTSDQMTSFFRKAGLTVTRID